MAMLSEMTLELAALVTEEAMARSDVLIQPAEAPFVRETPTGLAFEHDTPLAIWSLLTVRLIVQHKRMEWALADAVNFGRDAYGDLYAQWVQETGLNKRTLQNYARIGERIEPARRRATISFSHHAEVAALPAPEQKSLLDRAESDGWNRYELRDAVREHKRRSEDQSVVDEARCWVPVKGDLAPEARAALEQRLTSIGKRHSIGYERGFIDALVWLQQEDCFEEWRQ